MKLKNLKAQNKKVKVEDITIVEHLDDCQDSEQDVGDTGSGQKTVSLN